MIATRKAEKEILESMGLKEAPVYDKGQFAIFSEAVEVRKKELIDRWESIGNESMEFGNWIDNNLSAPLRGQKCDPKLQHIVDDLAKEHRFYAEELDQVILYSDALGVCGTTDRISLRPGRTEPRIVDIFDYKTGINKGIVYDSNYWKDGKKYFKNEFLMPPLEHIEECTYTRYALQLAAYGVLAEIMYGVKVGMLAIIYVSLNEDNSISYKKIPVPYMKWEIQTLFQQVRATKDYLQRNSIHD